ncbi:MAG: hypothetical protein GWN46_01555 [Gammaproteobacteria bacterium]|nr:hypothetical protein [Gammaproteobacteria bacterium]
MAEIQQWLSFSVNEMFNGPAMARAMVIFNRDFDAKRARAFTDTTLDHLEFPLQDHDRLALDRFTPADIACYPYVALIHEDHVSLDAFPSIRASIARVEALPGYVSMPGLPFPG